eukprot:11128277-Karenia_brevis.AAC.1
MEAQFKFYRRIMQESRDWPHFTVMAYAGTSRWMRVAGRPPPAIPHPVGMTGYSKTSTVGLWFQAEE